jgi:hypothetical protein
MDVLQRYANEESAAGHTGLRHSFRTPGFSAFLVLISLIAALRALSLALNGTDLYTDEAQYWAWAQSLELGYFSKPPLIAWLIHGATAICGDGEACVRAPSALLHAATAMLIYGLGKQLYSADVGFCAGLGYALLPAVSLSSGIISTDVPLLAAWSLALVAFARLLAAPTIGGTVLLALAIGVGLNAKYAMAYFVLCAAFYFVIAPEHRSRLRLPHLWLAFFGGAALIVPNLLWNATNGFVTLSHTAANANWRGIPFHPDKAAEFFLSQFGVFGPILFGALLVILWRAVKRPQDNATADKLLIAYSLPIIAIVFAQAFASRAHANWAAPAYVAAIVLVTAAMIRDREWGWMRTSFALHAALAILISVATWQAGRIALPGIGDPFARTLGNREFAAKVRDELAEARRKGKPIGSVMTDDRDLAAALAYYGRDLPLPVLSWRSGSAPQHHFESVRPFTAATPEPVLFVSERPAPALLGRFGSVSPAKALPVPAGRHSTRTVYVSTLAHFSKR